MKKCVFCDILENKTSHGLIIENKHARAFAFDFFREGHCTIILRKHKNSISEVDIDEYHSVFDLIIKVSKALEKKYECEKTYLLSIGDKVEHIHFHLIPKRRDKCSMGVYCFEKLTEVEGERHPSDDELNALAKEIRNLVVN